MIALLYIYSLFEVMYMYVCCWPVWYESSILIPDSEYIHWYYLSMSIGVGVQAVVVG